jgi:hypothetical protein
MMNTRGSVAFLIAVLGAGCQAPPEGAPAKAPHEPWLQGDDEAKFRQVENQFRGMDVAMMEVGYRFSELYFAGRDRNWPYAKYQAEKIGHVVRLGLERRPKRAPSAQPFLAEEIPAILQAVEKQTPEAFQAGIERLRAACMRCHVLEKLPDFILEFPEHRPSPIRRAAK